jgi:hypothetical protein
VRIHSGAPVPADPYADVPAPEEEWCSEGPVPGSDPYVREPGTVDSSTVPGTDPEPHDLGESTVPSSVVPVPEPGTAGSGPSAVPGSRIGGAEPGTAAYCDVAALLDGTLPKPPTPGLLKRSDGCGLFYAGQVNWVFGDPESGKTWVCLACAVEILNAGGKVIVVDLDHNGAPGTVSRLLALGASVAALRDPARFLYCEPEDRTAMLAVVAHMAEWKPDVAVVDSIGELLPLFGSSSNSADDFTTVHTRVLKPLARTGAAVLAVDHLAKGQDSRAHGPGGTAAKRRAIGGVSIRVKVKDAFTPGVGGSAYLSVNKDRHGGLRAHCPTGDREPLAGLFKLNAFADGVLTWSVSTPGAGERNPDESAPPGDVAAVAALDPVPETVDDAQLRLRWGRQRTARAVKAWREQEAA